MLANNQLEYDHIDHLHDGLVDSIYKGSQMKARETKLYIQERRPHWFSVTQKKWFSDFKREELIEPIIDLDTTRQNAIARLDEQYQRGKELNVEKVSILKIFDKLLLSIKFSVPRK